MVVDKQNNRNMLPAATMLEGITALVLITIAFTIGTMIFGNITSSSRSHQQVKARLLGYSTQGNSWNSNSVQGMEVSVQHDLTSEGTLIRTTTVTHQDNIISTKKELVLEAH